VSASVSSSASPTAPLAVTGSNHTPTTLAGIALVLLGGVMLFLGRKPRRATH
jgi:LPXTG-motif cell wall-anchored protein